MLGLDRTNGGAYPQEVHIAATISHVKDQVCSVRTIV